LDQIFPSVVGLTTMLVSIGGTWLVARRYQRMGGGTAQLELNSTLTATLEAQSKELASLRRQLDDAQVTIGAMAADFKACKSRLIKLERALADKAIGEA
jgi:hypothetical protein